MEFTSCVIETPALYHNLKYNEVDNLKQLPHSSNFCSVKRLIEQKNIYQAGSTNSYTNRPGNHCQLLLFNFQIKGPI